ncbi:UDP-glucosyltransferase family protein [Medicago truncatula]|uniref:UDP-glucosyltransferase family protein n=2 Tax=Medicago truncatula TaxID=3880 RepID=A0A072TFZ2_MEDTR|nr:UDP-glucosyltransferase family protein [Medicago truncatula]
MPFTIQAAEEHALPIVLFSTGSACSFLSALHFCTLFQKGLIPLKGDESYLTNGYLDNRVDGIPGLQNFRLKDLLDVLRTTNPNDFRVNFIIETEDRFHKASTIVFNTYDELESGSNLWKEDTKCLEWLASKEPESVVYVNFGSITVMTPDQLLEFAWVLTNCKKSFLWIIRPDLVIGGSFILSSEFENEISDRGLIASWCPQEQVLNHPSIGGFLTHCGWNSTIESICVGVPMLCWPFFADQPTNYRYISHIWETGMEIDTNVKREKVTNMINELMSGDKGMKMRQKAMELKKKAEENTSSGGCSYMNLDKVIKEVMLKQC